MLETDWYEQKSIQLDLGRLLAVDRTTLRQSTSPPAIGDRGVGLEDRTCQSGVHIGYMRNCLEPAELCLCYERGAIHTYLMPLMRGWTT